METHTPIAFCLTELETSKKTLEGLAEQLPKLRAFYAKHKGAAKEQEALADLGKAVKKLLKEVFSVIPRLTEYGDDSLAQTANRFYEKLKAFDYLGHSDYTGLCAAVLRFSEGLPTADNAVNMGKLAHLANRARMGYFPTDLSHVQKLRRAMVFPETTVHLIDPCCGEGLALETFAKGANAKTYGVELDEVRGAEAQKRLDRVGFGSYFHSRISLGAFQALWLNPPYLSVPSEHGNRRLEKAFLSDSMRLLQKGGVLVYIIPYYRFTYDVCRALCDNFCDLRVSRFTGKEFERFHQVALIGVKTERHEAEKQAKRLSEYLLHPDRIPTIDDLPEGIYRIPEPIKKPELFKGAVFNMAELSEQLKKSASSKYLFENRTLDHKDRRPLLPLNLSQIGLVGASGMMNGLVECDTPHIMKGRIIKEKKTDVREEEPGKLTVKEITSNKLIFNVLTPTGLIRLG